MGYKRNITQKEKKLASNINKTIGKLNSINEIKKTLIKNGFIYKSSGAYKRVYKHPTENYCVKVYMDEEGWMEDSYRVPSCLKPYYLFPIYKNKKYIIQKWANSTANKKTIRLPERIYNSDYDIHRYNIKVHKNREVIIDFCNAV